MTIDVQGPPQAWLARPYTQLLRGPNFTWWRPLWSTLIAAGALVLMFAFAMLLFVGAGMASGLDLNAGEDDLMRWQGSPPGLLVLNLSLASLILVAQGAVWGGFGWRPRWVSSVVGGIRWPWLIRASVVSLAVMVVGNAILVLLDGGLKISLENNAGWYALIVLLTTPWQAAGEEYFFRGWLSQSVGSWFAHPVVGAVAAALVSATIFAMLHGPQNVWLFADRFAFGLVASWLVWRTGGLEAGIAMHLVNNVLSFAISVVTGSMEDAFTSTEADMVLVIIDIVLFSALALVLDRLARRWNIARRFTPPVRAW